MQLKTRAPFYLYQKQTKSGRIWYASFWNEQKGRYTPTRSTGIPVSGKKGRRRDAEKEAQAILTTIHPKTQEVSFIGHVAKFWRPDSPYVMECAIVKKKPLDPNYIKMNRDDVERHIRTFPPFRGLPLDKLKPGHIRDWQLWMAQKNLSGSRINSILNTMRVPVRYAVQREELERDPFKSIKSVPERPKEKGVLLNIEVLKIINVFVEDPRKHLAVLLGVLCGMRRGEVRGLQWQDIDMKKGLINICHNFIDNVGLKFPKHDSKRFFPLPDAVKTALSIVRSTSKILGPQNYILESLDHPGKPLGNKFIAKSLEQILLAIGICEEEQKTRNLTFHGLRHTFVTLARMAGISELEIQALTGHKSAEMMNRYTHAETVIDFVSMKEKFETAIRTAV